MYEKLSGPAAATRQRALRSWGGRIAAAGLGLPACLLGACAATYPAENSLVGDGAVAGPKTFDAAVDAGEPLVPCADRPVVDCDANLFGLAWRDVTSPIERTTIFQLQGGDLGLLTGGLTGPCLIARDGCAELRVDFDGAGCLERVHWPTPWDGGPRPGMPTFPPTGFEDLVSCNRRAWSSMRWTCLADRTVFQREECFE